MAWLWGNNKPYRMDATPPVFPASPEIYRECRDVFDPMFADNKHLLPVTITLESEYESARLRDILTKYFDDYDDEMLIKALFSYNTSKLTTNMWMRRNEAGAFKRYVEMNYYGVDVRIEVIRRHEM